MIRVLVLALSIISACYVAYGDSILYGTKSGVNLDNLTPATSIIIVAAYVARKELGFQKPIITSGNDGKHIKKSKHYSGGALDLRIKDMPFHYRRLYYKRLNELLGSNYEIMFYKDHIHVELSY